MHSLAIFLSQTAQDISEVNVLALFECLSIRESSLLNKDEPNQSSSCCQSKESLVTEEKMENDPPASPTHTEPEQHPAEQQTQELGNVILCQNSDSEVIQTNSTETISFLYICFVSLCVFAGTCRDLLNLSGVKVSFLSPDSLSRLPLKNKYSNLFNTIFCSAR